MIGGYIGAKICDFMSLKKTIIIGIIAYMVNCLLSLGVSFLNVLPLSCGVCCIWGFVTNYVQSNELVICSKLYEGKTESYGIVRQFHSVSLISYEIFAIFTKNSVELKYIMLVLFFFGFPALYLLKGIESVENATEQKYSLIS